jgi:hypothetical protein
MATTALALAQAQLDEINAAITGVLTRGQTVTLNGRAFARAELEQLREMRKEAERKVARLTRGGLRVFRGVPL